MSDRGSLAGGNTVIGQERFSRRTFRPPQNDSTEEIVSHRFLADGRNDNAIGIASKDICANFSSKGVSSGTDMKLARIGCTRCTTYSRQ